MAIEIDRREKLCLILLLVAARICVRYGDKELTARIDEIIKDIRN